MTKKLIVGLLLLAVLISKDIAFASGLEPPVLTFGVTTDIHVDAGVAGDATSGKDKWVRCLEYFNQLKVDAVIVAGDLADQGFKEDLALVKKGWVEVFGKGNRRSDGGEVVPLFIYGDHDTGGYLHDKRHEYDSWFRAIASRFPAEIRDAKSYEDYMYARSIYYPVESKLKLPSQAAECWKQYFDDKYEPYRLVSVKGFKFILEHFGAERIWKHDHGSEISLTEYIANRIPDKNEMFFFAVNVTPENRQTIRSRFLDFIS